jgi:predicted DCC family thiol-disulfide oxidoreductase YuxK
VLYDGACALCQGTVRWLIAEDADGSRFRFAPQAGTARRLTVETADGRRYEGSTAVLHCWRRLGGLWRLLAEILRWVPRSLRDLAYDAFARVRHVLFGGKFQACPRLPRHLRSRFL